MTKFSLKMLTNSILLGSFPVGKMVDILCHIGTGLEELNEVYQQFILFLKNQILHR